MDTCQLFSFKITLYWKKEHFATSITIAITAMLVMYTLNSSISSKLPETAGIKFIDIWIIYGLFIHFVILFLLVLIEHLPARKNIVFVDDTKNRQRKERNLNENTEMFAKKCLPIVQLVCVSAYIFCACLIYTGYIT